MNNKYKIILLFLVLGTIEFGVLFLAGTLTKHKWVVKVTYCNSLKVDTLSFTSTGGSKEISTYKEAVPVLVIGNKRVINVCDYEVLSDSKLK